MTPLGNISLNKILEKIARMFMKQNYGHAFQLIKRCFALTIRGSELNGKISNIVAHGKGGANVLRFMLNGIFA
jgi:hypothetical protein